MLPLEAMLINKDIMLEKIKLNASLIISITFIISVCHISKANQIILG